MDVKVRILSVAAVIIGALLFQGPLAFCDTTQFAPTATNKNPPPGKAPNGMVWIAGGEFSMGAVVNADGVE